MEAVEAGKDKNTARCYLPKAIEFKEFCAAIFESDENPQYVTEKKAFLFLFYQAHWTKKRVVEKNPEKSP